MKKKFLIMIAAALIFMQTFSVSTAFGTNSSDSSDEESTQGTESTKSTEAATKKPDNSSKIAEKESENQKLSQKIAKLNKEIEQTRLDSAILQQDIKNSGKTLENLSGSIDYNKERLKKRLRAIYMSGGTSNIEIILGAKSFDEFMDKMEYAAIISEHDNNIISSLSGDVRSNKKTLTELNASKQELEKKNKELEKKRKELLTTLEENKAALDVLYSESAKANKSSEDDIEKKISDYYKKQTATEPSTEKKKSSSKKDKSKTSSSSSSSSKTEATRPSVITSNGDNYSNSSSEGDYNYENDYDNEHGYNNNYEGEAPNIVIPDAEVSSSGFVWPVTGFYNLTSLWNEDRGSYNHGAIDIASYGIDGQNVLAAHSGTVMYCENNCIHNVGKSSSCGCGGGYGNYVMLDHGDGHMTVYAHMSSITVYTGQSIEAGQLLGFVGSTGDSTGAHLHFETRYNGVKYNPMSEYPDISVTSY